MLRLCWANGAKRAAIARTHLRAKQVAREKRAELIEDLANFPRAFSLGQRRQKNHGGDHKSLKFLRSVMKKPSKAEEEANPPSPASEADAPSPSNGD